MNELSENMESLCSQNMGVSIFAEKHSENNLFFPYFYANTQLITRTILFLSYFKAHTAKIFACFLHNNAKNIQYILHCDKNCRCKTQEIFQKPRKVQNKIQAISFLRQHILWDECFLF